MHRRFLLTAALSSLAALGLSVRGASAVDEGHRLSGPIVHGNLAIYFVHGPSADGPVPLTLQEAMLRGAVQVHETSNVNELQIENVSDQEVFVQSGDIVKGGKQDRVLMVSLVLPPKSGRLPIASFCVEQGRWSARGREDVSRFSSADAAVPSREAKVAMKAPRAVAEPPATSGDGRPMRTGDARTYAPHVRARRSETGERQQEVWRSVASTQARLSGALGAPVAAPQSQSSLQLSLENEKLRDLQAAYVQALKNAGEKHDDILGYVFAINGRLNSADLYPSNALFKKMWPKLLDASITEAIGERNAAAEPLPTVEAVTAFLDAAERGKPQQRELMAGLRLETRDGDKAFYFATERAGGGWLHRNYLAK